VVEEGVASGETPQDSVLPTNLPPNNLPPADPPQSRNLPPQETPPVKAVEVIAGEASPPANNQQVPAQQVPGASVTKNEILPAGESRPGVDVAPSPEPVPGSAVNPDSTTPDNTDNSGSVTPNTTTENDNGREPPATVTNVQTPPPEAVEKGVASGETPQNSPPTNTSLPVNPTPADPKQDQETPRDSVLPTNLPPNNLPPTDPPQSRNLPPQETPQPQPVPNAPRQEQGMPRPETPAVKVTSVEPQQNQDPPTNVTPPVKAVEVIAGAASPPANNQQVPTQQVPGASVTKNEILPAGESRPGVDVAPNPDPVPGSAVNPDTTTPDTTTPDTTTPDTTTAPIRPEPKGPVDYNTPPPRSDESEDKPKKASAKKASEKELNFVQSDELDGEAYNAPTASPEDSVSVVEDTEIRLNTRYFGFADADNDALLDILILGVSGGQLLLNGDVVIIPDEGVRLPSSAVSSYAIRPDANSETPISVEYQLRDETYLESKTQTFVINVDARNDAPEWAFNQQRFLLIEETAAGTTPAARATGFFVKAYDVEGQALTYSVVDEARFFFVGNELWIKEGVVLDGDYTADSDSLPYFILRVTASDGEATSSDLEVLIRVTDKPDEAIQVNELGGLSVAENSTSLTGAAQLSMTTRETGPEVEYRLVGGSHDLVTLTPDGVISLHTAPDYETVQQISFAVEARHVIDGQGADEGWQGRQQISITVGNRNDEGLTLDAEAAVDVAEGETDTGHVVSATLHDAAGGDVTYAITNGVDHKRFTIDPNTGILRFSADKKITDHEKPRDRDKDNVYEL